MWACRRRREAPKARRAHPLVTFLTKEDLFTGCLGADCHFPNGPILTNIGSRRALGPSAHSRGLPTMTPSTTGSAEPGTGAPREARERRVVSHTAGSTARCKESACLGVAALRGERLRATAVGPGQEAELLLVHQPREGHWWVWGVLRRIGLGMLVPCLNSSTTGGRA